MASEEKKKSAGYRLARYFLQYKYRLLGGMTTTAILGGLDVAAVTGISHLVDILSEIATIMRNGGEFVVEKHIDYVDYTLRITSFRDIALFVGVIFIAVFGKAIFMYFHEYLMNSAAHKILMRLRLELFDKILVLPMKYYDREKTGGVMSRITNDVVNIEQSTASSISLIKNGLQVIIFVAAMLLTSWTLTLFVLVVFPAFAVLLRVYGRRIRSISRRISLNVADITAFLQEKINAITIIKSFTRERDERERFREMAYENYKYSMKNVRQVATLKPMNETLGSLSMVLVILFASYYFVQGEMTMDVMTRFILLVLLAYQPIRTLGKIHATMQKALASAVRIFELLDAETERRDRPDAIKLADVKGEIEFRNVSFAYEPGKPALRNVSFRVPPGKTFALVGPSGGGKTTTIKLIPRFYEIDEGAILVDGKDAREVEISSLREHIGMVTQETILFADTVFENLRYGKLDATREEVVEAAKAANAHRFISEISKGYDAFIGERGVQLSGGQRQRVAIARAILRDPKILLLDEATSALDSESETLIQAALEKLLRSKTSLVVAHRLSTIQNADRILVIENGSLVEQGTHGELLEKGGLYRKLHEIQFKD